MRSTIAALPAPLPVAFPTKPTALRPVVPLIDAGRALGQYKNRLPPASMTPEGVSLARRHRIAKMLSALLDIVRTAHSLAPVLDYIVAQTGPLLDATASALYRLDHNHDCLALQSSWGLPTSFATFACLPLTEKPAVKEALLANRPLLIPTLARDPFYLDSASPSCQQMLLESGAYTMLVAPLTVQEERYGALLLYFVDRIDLAEEDCALAMTFARKAACAIESALAWQADDQTMLVAEKKTNRRTRKGQSA